mgnify:CR=1 FL=1
MRKWILIAVAVVVIAVATLAVLANTVLKESDSGGSGSEDPYAAAGRFGSHCTDEPVDFTTWPWPVDSMTNLVPMGSVSSEHIDPTDHLYVTTGSDYAAADVPLSSPAAGRIVEAYSLKGIANTNTESSQVAMDVGLQIQFGCRYYARLAHLHSLSPEVAAGIGDLPNGQSKQVDIPVTAGQLLGNVGMSSDLAILDLQSEPKSFVNAQDYAAEPWKQYTVDPIPLFPTSVQSALAKKNLRTESPAGGKFDFDVPGTAQGVWFPMDAVGIPTGGGEPYWKRMLSLAPYWLDSSVSMVTSGDVGGEWGFFFVQDSTAFTSIKAGAPVRVIPLVDAQKWGKSDRATPEQVAAAPVAAYLVVQVDSGERLTAEIIRGSTPPKGFSGTPTNYAR